MTMSNLLQDKLMKKMKLQFQALDSPSDFNNVGRSGTESVMSPMTDLAINLSDTSLNSLTPVQDSKRRLSLGSDSSTPSPGDKHESFPHLQNTPLSSLTNKPRRTLQTSKLPFSLKITDDMDHEANKENIPLPGYQSPGKKSGKSHSSKTVNKASSCTTFPNSPVKGLVPRKFSAPAVVSFSPGKCVRSPSMKKPIFQILDDVEDADSRDSGYNSQNLIQDGCKERPNPGSMEDILSECSPGKDEDGVTPLKSSPERDTVEVRNKVKTDGFDFNTLDPIAEDRGGEESPCIDLTSLLSNRILEQPETDDNIGDTKGKPAVDIDLMSEAGGQLNLDTGSRKMFKNPNRKIRRALSMFDKPPTLGSPVSRFSNPPVMSLVASRFKRPEPPRPDLSSDVMNKRRRLNEEPALLPGSSSAAEKRPKFFRSHSENQLSVMKSCELKEEIADILPDSSRLYALPAIVDAKHPSLRSISCDTLANLLTGKYDHLVQSFRIIDCRYSYEYQAGHIRHAENWQHGEDEEFINEFLPVRPLDSAPHYNPSSEKSRNILIFHCEFSSKRGPDFYNKLRERDRMLNQHVYPALYHPEIYLLHLGYKEFFQRYPHLTTGSYTTMDDPRHQEDYRKMRAKSKSWSGAGGGTIQRTGKQSRMLYM